MAQRLARRWAHRRRHGTPAVRSAAHAVWPGRVERDVLPRWHRPLAHTNGRVRLGAGALGGSAAGGVGAAATWRPSWWRFGVSDSIRFGPTAIRRLTHRPGNERFGGAPDIPSARFKVVRRVSVGQFTRRPFNGRADYLDGRRKDVRRCIFLTILILLVGFFMVLPGLPDALWIVGVYYGGDDDNHSSLLSDVGPPKASFSVMTAPRLIGTFFAPAEKSRTSTDFFSSLATRAPPSSHVPGPDTAPRQAAPAILRTSQS